jgi:hypothetical protein
MTENSLSTGKTPLSSDYCGSLSFANGFTYYSHQMLRKATAEEQAEAEIHRGEFEAEWALQQERVHETDTETQMAVVRRQHGSDSAKKIIAGQIDSIKDDSGSA